MEETVLVVEDESDVVDLLRYHLSRAGFNVIISNDGLEGLELARRHRPDVMVLDWMLPGMPGDMVCRTLKKEADTQQLPIIMLTAKSGVPERIQGLEAGADDYVSKPFSPREIVLRVQGLMRRSRASAREEVLKVDDFEVDRGTFEVRLQGKRLDLTSTEFKLLTILIERRGRTQSRETLLFDVWGYVNAIDTRTVDTHMRRLREKLGAHAPRLETIRGEGYRFNPLAEN